MPKVAEIMTDKLITVSPDTTLGEALGLMKSHGCRQLPVVTADRLVGIVTDRDVRLALNSPLTLHERVEDQALLSSATAEACMTPNPMTVDANASVSLAAELMLTYKFGGLPVMRAGKLVGIITVSDILAHYVDLIESMESSPVSG
jgi:acetoin utilization protein AcuB